MRAETVVGWHAVLAVLKQAPERVLAIRLDPARKGPRSKQLLDAARTAGIAVEMTTGEALDREAGHANHQGVLAHCRAAAERTEGELPGFLAGLPEPALASAAASNARWVRLLEAGTEIRPNTPRGACGAPTVPSRPACPEDTRGFSPRPLPRSRTRSRLSVWGSTWTR